MQQAWFEMSEIRKRNLEGAVWIPLRASESQETGDYGHLNYKYELFGLGSLAVPLSMREQAKALSWSDIGLVHTSGPYATKATYKPADIYSRDGVTDFGVDLVLEQSFEGAAPTEWHLNQDLVIALGLYREGDDWLCPKEGYVDVAHLRRSADGEIAKIEIRNEFLKDYLCARQMALKTTSYRTRRVVLENADHIVWPPGGIRESTERDRFETRVIEIHEGGGAFGAETAVFHVSRTDMDQEVDVPTLPNPADGEIESKSWRMKRKGRKLFHVEGELWRDEWIEPAAVSPRVRWDDVPSTCYFITDAAGTRQVSDELRNEDVGRWLWFQPAVIRSLMERRGGSLEWYTRHTGGVQALHGYNVHFGINAKDFITVYAYDIARLPEWQQRIWQGFNIAPDGKVSEELLAAQVRASPADTKAPESELAAALDDLDDAFFSRWAVRVMRHHPDTNAIIQRTHRFRALNKEGLLELAKDVARLTIDSFNVSSLHAIAPLAKTEKKGSLKSLECAIGTLVPASDAHRMMAPFFGIYELRLGDAHPTKSGIEDSFELVGIDGRASHLTKGIQLLDAAVGVIKEVAATIRI